MTDEFCPVPDSLRSSICRLIDGQIVSKKQPCPEQDYCSNYMADLAGAWPMDIQLYGQEKPRD